MTTDQSSFLAVDSPFFSAIVLFKTDRHFPRVFGGFQKEGSLERMEMEATPRSLVSPHAVLLFRTRHMDTCVNFHAAPRKSQGTGGLLHLLGSILGPPIGPASRALSQRFFFGREGSGPY